MSKANRKGTGNHAGVVIKREEVVEGEAHGGAWKVAYADFVTAMMAFFLLMWLLNATTEDQRKGLADYFSPNSLLSHASSGTGDPFGGHTAFDQGALVSDRGAVQAMSGARPTPLEPSDADANPDVAYHKQAEDDRDDESGQQGQSSGDAAAAARASTALAVGTPGQASLGAAAPAATRAGVAAVIGVGSGPRGAVDGTPARAAVSATGHADKPTDAELREAQTRQEKADFARAAEEIRAAVGGDPALAELARQLVIDMTPQGLRIQIMDAEQRPMFPLGSAEPNERARLLLQKVTPVLARLPEAISVAGHTDAAPFSGSGRTNWELSTERANATRRLLAEGGLPDGRIRSVTGNADRDLVLPKEPLAAANRRIAIIVLRGTGPVPTAAASVIPPSPPPATQTVRGAVAGTVPVAAPSPPMPTDAAAPVGDALPAGPLGSAAGVPIR